MIPTAAQTLDDVGPILPALYQALEEGTLGAREFFESRGARIEPYLAPNLVRYKAKQVLAESVFCRIEADRRVRYEIEDIANNGLCVRFDRFRLRILKSDEGDIPEPTSSARHRYYEQLALAVAGDDPRATLAARVNLVVLWDVDSAYNLTGLMLALPSATEPDGQVRCHWQIPVPHPATTAAQAEIDLTPDDIDDLDISPLDEDASGTDDER